MRLPISCAECLSDARIVHHNSRRKVRLHALCARCGGKSEQLNQGDSAMGPFPHDAPAAVISADNPMGTDGFEFVEYAHPNPAELHALFRLMRSEERRVGKEC